jgi:hypothetical protein
VKDDLQKLFYRCDKLEKQLKTEALTLTRPSSKAIVRKTKFESCLICDKPEVSIA